MTSFHQIPGGAGHGQTFRSRLLWDPQVQGQGKGTRPASPAPRGHAGPSQAEAAGPWDGRSSKSERSVGQHQGGKRGRARGAALGRPAGWEECATCSFVAPSFVPLSFCNHWGTTKHQAPFRVQGRAHPCPKAPSPGASECLSTHGPSALAGATHGRKEATSGRRPPGLKRIPGWPLVGA